MTARTLTPFEMATRLQRSRDWHLKTAGDSRRRDTPDWMLAEAEVARIDGYLAQLGFAPRPPWGPAVA
jgi:hypothetical protein